MSSFAAELREVAERLDLPQPMRARVLLELAADLTGLEAEFVSAGVNPTEARSRASHTLVPSTDALRDLRGIHRPLYQRLVDRFSDPARHRIERFALALTSAVMFAAGIAWLGKSGILTDPAPLMGVLLAVGLLVVLVSLWKLFTLRVKRDHDLSRLRRGLWILPAAGIASIVLGLGGTALDLYAVAGRLVADPSAQMVELVTWLRRDMGLLALGLLTSAIAWAMWLLIAADVARVEQAEAEVLAGINIDSTMGSN